MRIAASLIILKITADTPSSSSSFDPSATIIPRRRLEDGRPPPLLPLQPRGGPQTGDNTNPIEEEQGPSIKSGESNEATSEVKSEESGNAAPETVASQEEAGADSLIPKTEEGEPQVQLSETTPKDEGPEEKESSKDGDQKSQESSEDNKAEEPKDGIAEENEDEKDGAPEERDVEKEENEEDEDQKFNWDNENNDKKDTPEILDATGGVEKEKGDAESKSALKTGEQDIAQGEKSELHQTCVLLGKFGSFGWYVQLCLLILCFSSLIYKRFVDKVRRSWLVWWFDVSKQGFGTCLTHTLNLCLAKMFEFLVNVEADACNWYFINITLDTTLGCLIVMMLVLMMKQFYIKILKRPDLARIGEYGKPPNWRIWRRQLFDFMILTVVEKMCMVILVVITAPTLTYIVGFFLDLFSPYPNVKLTIVMVIWPLLCSVAYFWVVDNFLQAKDDRILVETTDKDEAQKRHSQRSFNGQFSGVMDDEIFNFEDWKRRHRISDL